MTKMFLLRLKFIPITGNKYTWTVKLNTIPTIKFITDSVTDFILLCPILKKPKLCRVSV